MSHLTRTLPALGQINGRMDGTPLLEWLCQRLQDPEWGVRLGLAKALERMMAQGIRTFRRGKVEGKRVEELANL
ncbi:MAG: hypothetical protein QXP01_08870 [Candidatus Hadarchaeum sp.]